ncbi:MAG: NfeD family protein [Bacteroidales bacterium]|nr:NfeD family protein [Bacteroidales bacterium]
MEIWQIWVIAALVFFIIEICTSGFAIACLSVGCLFSAVGAAFEISMTWQVAFFALGAFLAFIFIRPLVLKLMDKKSSGNKVTTNMDNVIGKKAVVTEKIESEGYGRVKIDGDDWKAKMEDDSEAEVGEKVTVISYESIILTVKK